MKREDKKSTRGGSNIVIFLHVSRDIVKATFWNSGRSATGVEKTGVEGTRHQREGPNDKGNAASVWPRKKGNRVGTK